MPFIVILPKLSKCDFPHILGVKCWLKPNKEIMGNFKEDAFYFKFKGFIYNKNEKYAKK
jgi:hypothetical protein